MTACEAKSYKVRGRVQGVGFRTFVERVALELDLTGWVRNLDDGGVEVHAQGTRDQLQQLEGFLWKGPRWAEVRGVESMSAAPVNTQGFRIK